MGQDKIYGWSAQRLPFSAAQGTLEIRQVFLCGFSPETKPANPLVNQEEARFLSTAELQHVLGRNLSGFKYQIVFDHLTSKT